MNELIALALDGAWPAIDEKVRNFPQPQFANRDRKAAREKNKEGLDLFGRGEFAAATESFKKAISLDSGDVEVLNNLAFAIIRTGKYSSALPYLRQALLMAPTRAAAWLNVAEAFAEMDKVSAAEAALTLAIHFSRDRTRAMVYLTTPEATADSKKFKATIDRVYPKLDTIPQYSR